MSEYNATAKCRDLRCTVVEYAYDDEGGKVAAPECPACHLREEQWSVVTTRLAAVEGLVADPPVILNHGELALRYSRVRAALATGTKGQVCVHCGRRFTGSAHDEGDHRGKQRCDPDDTGQPYGLNAHAPGTPCQSPCAGARANQEAKP